MKFLFVLELTNCGEIGLEKPESDPFFPGPAPATTDDVPRGKTARRGKARMKSVGSKRKHCFSSKGEIQITKNK